MTNEITPPPELVQQWLEDGPEDGEFGISKHIATQAASWGADQELEACCEWFQEFYKTESWVKHDLKHFRDARRPANPPSLKETLLARVARIPGEGADTAYLHHWLENESQQLVDALHKAINSLPD